MFSRTKQKHAVRRHAITRMMAWELMAWAMVVLLSACVLSPQPEPPSIDTNKIAVTFTDEEPGEPDPDTVNVTGRAGAVSPGSVRLSIINIDDAQAWTEVDVDSDGSFEASLPGMPGNELHLQIIYEGQRLDPVHVVVPDEDGPVEPSEQPLGDCLWIDPLAGLDFGQVEIGDVAAFEIGIRNDCEDEEIVFDEVWLALQGEDEWVCEFEFEECVSGDTSDTEFCDEELIDCEQGCHEEHQACIDDGTPVDECLNQIIDCAYICLDENMSCIVDFCEEQFEECDDSPSGLHHGFELLVAELPLYVPPETSRMVVVTFSPLDDGHAEELLIFDVFEPEEDRRSLVLTADGVW